LHASATGTGGGAGVIGLIGCDVTQASGTSSLWQATASQGQIQVEARGHTTIGGTIRAAGGQGQLVYPQNPPVIQGSASISPSPTVTQDATLPACAPSAVCGNGILELGEQCDDGNTLPCDGCSPTCTQEVCGNGVVDCGEECDAGAANGAPG